jgi:hypothetical protein
MRSAGSLTTSQTHDIWFTATGKGSAAAQASSISRSVATAAAAVFTRALAAIKIIKQIQNSVQTAVASAVAMVRNLTVHRSSD